MKIEYRHCSNPDVTKVHDTRMSLIGCRGFLNFMGAEHTQESWDKFTLEKFERDLKRGVVLSYSIIEGGTAYALP